MKKIEAFNRELNESAKLIVKDKETLSIQVNLLLKSILQQLHATETAIIIGAGKMEDFSPIFFVNNFKETVFTDIDLGSVVEKIDFLELTEKQKKKITMIRIEYTGFENNLFFLDFQERVMKCKTHEELNQTINSRLFGLENYRFLKNYQEGADLIYLSPIYTQLIYNQVLHECSLLREKGYPEHLLKFIEHKLLDDMVGVIDRFNQNIVDTLKNDGILVALSDIFQVDLNSDFYLRIKNGFKNYDVMEEIYEGYVEQYGVGLGDYGLVNMDEKMKPYLSRWLLWPFDESNAFIVKLKVYKKERKIKEEVL